MARKISDDISHMLPTAAYDKGYSLTWEAPPQQVDPIDLTLRGRRLYQWDYIPSLTEVFEVCKQLEVNDGS